MGIYPKTGIQRRRNRHVRKSPLWGERKVRKLMTKETATRPIIAKPKNASRLFREPDSRWHGANCQNEDTGNVTRV